MKLPRNISGNELIKKLGKLDYEVTRQTGSHIRLTTETKGKHSLTIPAHNPLRIGTLSSILVVFGFLSRKNVIILKNILTI